MLTARAMLPASDGAYCGPAPAPSGWTGQWNLDPYLIAVLMAAALALHLRGDPAQRRSGFAALALGAVLYLSPLCALGAALFSARVAHHLALALAVAPLIANTLRPRLAALPGSLMVWTLIDGAALWAWHSPALYDFAATDPGGYWLMQLSILGASIMFWARLMAAPPPAAVAALLAAMVQMGALGALITLAPTALYPAHYVSAAAWGLGPLRDQQWGGLIMWAPAAGAYLGAAMIFAARMLRPERTA